MRTVSAFASLVLLAAPMAAARTVMIGDSMFAGGSKVNDWLQEWAGHSIENIAIVGSSMHEGWTKSIPAEYAELDKTVMPATIIMDGGGNDVISKRSDCEAFNAACVQQIDEAVAIGANLLETMRKDGVQHVLWMGFFYISGLGAAADYGAQEVAKVCENATISCHVADLRDLDIPRGWDGVHPTEEGYKMLAARVWEVKEANDIPL